MNDIGNLWGQKNETLSDKSAEKEYGISHDEILEAINSRELQYKLGNMHGNPWFRLLRVEVEVLNYQAIVHFLSNKIHFR